MTSTSGRPIRRSAEDTMAIREVVVRYGFALDERDWDALRQVFTEDAVWEGLAPPGLEGIIQQLKVNQHPHQHVLANHLIEDVSDDEVIVWSKALFPGTGDLALEAVYRDVVVRTPDGWRVKHKSAKRFNP